MAAVVKISIHEEIVALARKVWKKMIDPHDGSIGITHDSYLKLFHLSEKRIPGNYDIIMMDEAQDANPVTSAIVAQQPGGKVYVGDRNQSIYAFRGAENAMDTIDATEYFLSSSFRFGPQIANVANHLLEYSLGDSARISGVGGRSTLNNAHQDGRHALLARTNGSLFFAAISALDSGKTVSIIGGPESLKLMMLMDVYRLSTGDEEKISEIISPVIKQFKNYDEMRKEVSNEEAEDVEMNSLCKVVDSYGGRLPALIAKISAKCNASTVDADVVLSTAHKSKGLEFDSVELADDFKKPNDNDGIEIQEANLLYVAVTRAKKNLVLSASMNDFMREPKKNTLLVQERMRKFNKMGV
jgi:superfamily I DNA/RNA helicase